VFRPRAKPSLFLWIALSISLIVPGPGRSQDLLREQLRHRLEEAAGQVVVAPDEPVHTRETTLRFYRARVYEPAWVSGQEISGKATDLITSIERAGDDGLRPGDYHFEAIQVLLRRAGGSGDPDPSLLVDLELLLTDAWLLYAAHRVSGRINPETIDAEWVATRREVDVAAALEKAIAADRVAEVLDDLLPGAPGYQSLRSALARYRLMASREWPARVPEGDKIHPGERETRIAGVRAILEAWGEIPADKPADPDSYDPDLEKAVRRFQARHGLDPDGVIGPKTLEALNTSPGRRARQIVLNLERWRWLPQDLGARHVRVNIADFRLDVVEEAHVVLATPVIVGRDYRRTPVFSASMTYLVLNPTWEVPHQLAVQDVLPQIRKDPDYIARLRFQVLPGWGAGEAPVDPSGIDWSELSPRNFPYRLRQLPGPANALGRVKFMFPNRFSVYLHDTPSKDLFRKTERAFSSGCIRVERPVDLAAYSLAGDPAWPRPAIEAAMDSGEERTVRLPVPLPVHLLYWTAWVDEDGTVQFRRDIYGRDARLDEAFREDPPEPGEVVP